MDRSDLTAALDERNGEGSQVMFSDKKSEDQRLPVQKVSASAVVEDGYDPMGERLYSLRLG